MPRTNQNDKTMDPDGLICGSLLAVKLGNRTTRDVADATGLGTKQAHSLLMVNHGRGNLTREVTRYGLATRIKWGMTPRGRRKLKQLDK